MSTLPHLTVVVPGLAIFEGESNGRFPHSHSFVVRGDTDVLIDAGCGLDRLAELTAVWHPEMLILSHSHPDHCAGAWMLEGTRVFSPIYGGYPYAEMPLRYWEGQMILKHLDRLEAKDLAERDGRVHSEITKATTNGLPCSTDRLGHTEGDADARWSRR